MVIIAIVLGGLMIKKRLSSSPNLSAAQNVSSINFSEAGINVGKYNQTLILAISTTCHFCSESADFYRKIAAENNGIHLVVVAPQSISDTESYLKKLSVQVSEIKQLPLNLLNVSGTPTLILVNKSEQITGVWVGKLSQQKEKEVLAAIKRDSIAQR